MSHYDAFEWAFDRAMRRAEEKHLNPPSERLIACHFCNATGSLGVHGCDACEETGFLCEPDEWREKDMFWETKYDEQREKECDK